MTIPSLSASCPQEAIVNLMLHWKDCNRLGPKDCNRLRPRPRGFVMGLPSSPRSARRSAGTARVA